MNDDFVKVGGLLKSANRVLFITGAGVSAESQIPTFRGATAAFADGMTEDGVPFEEVLSAETFVKNPKLAWKYLSILELSMRGKVPNAAHLAMAALQTPQRSIYVATQNIDELHQRAGSQNVFELHGNLRRISCTECNYSVHLETFEGIAKLPRCPRCDAILRPDVVLYGENLPLGVLDAFKDEQTKGFDLVFSVGTTSLFFYVVEPVLAAAQRGIPVVEINPETTPISEVADFRFAGPAGQTLRRLVQTAAID
jgi:NAD-dependent deacetylase